jgi:hypothetical protein
VMDVRNFFDRILLVNVESPCVRMRAIFTCHKGQLYQRTYTRNFE